MRGLLLRSVRLMRPVEGSALEAVDLLLQNGRVEEMGCGISPPAGTVVVEREGCVVAPAFLDLHTHLREPGQPWKERIATATAAAAAGGFGAVCAMANLRPPVDSVARLRECLAKNRSWERVPVLQFAAVSEQLAGQRLAPLRELADAGAAGFSDDGRNALGQELLRQALERAGAAGLTVAIHPEDEEVLAAANPWGGEDPTAWLLRPREAEVSAVRSALDALRSSGQGRLHLQHLSTSESVELLREAKRDGLAVTAEVTAHHLVLEGPLKDPEARDRELTCNPPLRGDADRSALWEGLADGTIDALASDHAPHESPSDPLQRRSPGFSGVQAQLSAVLSDPRGGPLLERVVAALTARPLAVLGPLSGSLPEPSVREGQPAHLTVFDPEGVWRPEPGSWLSLGTNSPFWERPLRGLVLATFSRGRVAFLRRELGWETELA